MGADLLTKRSTGRQKRGLLVSSSGAPAPVTISVQAVEKPLYLWSD